MRTTTYAAYVMHPSQMLNSHHVPMSLALVVYPGSSSIARDASFAMQQLQKSLRQARMSHDLHFQSVSGLFHFSFF